MAIQVLSTSQCQTTRRRWHPVSLHAAAHSRPR
ncbi:hypothetical protein Nmel_004541 [Mimus melanotis]